MHGKLKGDTRHLAGTALELELNTVAQLLFALACLLAGLVGVGAALATGQLGGLLLGKLLGLTRPGLHLAVVLALGEEATTAAVNLLYLNFTHSL